MKLIRLISAIYVALSFAVSSRCIGAEDEGFKPVNWKAYGLDRPSIDFVAGCPEWAAILKKSNRVILVKYVDANALPEGTSLSMDGVAIAASNTLPNALEKRLISLAIDAQNYGENRPYAWQADRKINPPQRDLYGLEFTDGKLFVRFYFYGGYRYCNLYCSIPSDTQTRSMTLILSPQLRNEIHIALKVATKNKK